VTGLRLIGVCLRVGGSDLLRGFDLEVGPGAVTTVMGPSGCGKSSLLSYVCGTLEPVFEAEGDIWLNGAAIHGLPAERRRVGILFQDDLLFPHLSVGENLAFALPPAVRGRERQDRIEAALRGADLAGFGKRDPATLSGGQRARVAVMRTLLSEPKALLLDEPFGKLDRALRDRFRGFVFGHARAAGLPTLLVTHDEADAGAAGGAVVAFPDLASIGRESPVPPLPAAGRRPV
jgi:putative thiamine transport system ATP-binding protein